VQALMSSAVKAGFGRFDPHGTGAISASSCGELIQELGGRMDAKQVESVVAELDSDGSGFIEFREFIDWWQLHGMRQTFRRFDVDDSGSIEAQELEMLLHSLGIRLEAEAMEAALRLLDPNGDGVITWDEYLLWWERFDIQRIFEQYDADRSGAISSVELQMLCADLGIFLSRREVKLAFDSLDRDGSSTVTFEEFLPWWQTVRKLKADGRLVVGQTSRGRWEDNLFLGKESKLESLKQRQRTFLLQLCDKHGLDPDPVLAGCEIDAQADDEAKLASLRRLSSREVALAADLTNTIAPHNVTETLANLKAASENRDTARLADAASARASASCSCSPSAGRGSSANGCNGSSGPRQKTVRISAGWAEGARKSVGSWFASGSSTDARRKSAPSASARVHPSAEPLGKVSEGSGSNSRLSSESGRTSSGRDSYAGGSVQESPSRVVPLRVSTSSTESTTT